MKKAALVLIVLLAGFLRLYHLPTIPALNADEAAIGYNAYSLLETGKDEHGNPWPIHFQSFNDWKPGLIFYLVMPAIKVFGLGVWQVRIIPAILGIATIPLLFLFVKKLFGSEKLATLSALMLAVSPWHIHFSRGAWEVNIATFLMLTGSYAFIESKNNKKYLFVSSLLFTLSLYSYHSARLVAPLLLLGFAYHSRKRLLVQSKSTLLAILLGLILISPLAIDLTQSEALSRASGVGLLADPGPVNRVNELRGQHSSYLGIFAKMMHNKPVNYGLEFLENWGDHYWGEFLFLSGDDIQRNKVPETGVLYLFEVITIPLGIYAVLKSKKKKNWDIIFWWFLIAPTTAALTFQSPHALRAQNMVIPLTILSANGIYFLINKQKSKAFLSLFVIIFVWSFARYEIMYWLHMSKEYKYSSQYGVEELVNYVKGPGVDYNKVLVTDRYDQPYILFLFYLKYPPQKFQGEHALTPRDKFGFSTVRTFDNYEFRSIDYQNDKSLPDTLTAGTEEEIPKDANVIKEIYGVNGLKYFRVIGN